MNNPTIPCTISLVKINILSAYCKSNSVPSREDNSKLSLVPGMTDSPEETVNIY